MAINKEVTAIAIDFMMFHKGKIRFHKYIDSVAFPQKLRLFFIRHQFEETESLFLLLHIDEYEDTLLSVDDMQMLLSFCEEVIQKFEFISDYSIYDEIKASGLKQQDIITFVSELRQLLTYALEHDKIVYAIVD